MNATETFQDKIKGRITALQGRLEAQMTERMKVTGVIERMDSAIQQMQGAITVLQELLEEPDERQPDTGRTDMAVGESVRHPGPDLNVVK